MEKIEKEIETMPQDKDFKYLLQDAGAIYVGARYSYAELLEEEMAAFKLKTILSRYILQDVDASTTLESHFYYMEEGSFSYQTFRELKVRIRVSALEEKKSLAGKTKSRYKDKIYTLKELAGLNLARKKQAGIIIREIIFSKLGLMTFTV